MCNSLSDSLDGLHSEEATDRTSEEPSFNFWQRQEIIPSPHVYTGSCKKRGRWGLFFSGMKRTGRETYRLSWYVHSNSVDMGNLILPCNGKR